MKHDARLNLLFIINPASGNKQPDYEKEIASFMKDYNHTVKYYTMPLSCSTDVIRAEIEKCQANRVIAVGGDGTLKLVAESALDMPVQIGIIPAGSANGMAKELQIPLNIKQALDVIVGENSIPISLVHINGEYCIHLSDIGFNAFVVKKFESQKGRGMWGYIKAAWHVLHNHSRMNINLKMDSREVVRQAAMVVIANATRYGSGAVINPVGRLDDALFEVVIVKKVSMRELFKMIVTHSNYDPKKTELLQATALEIKSKHRVHFQVDGEYLGKTNMVSAKLIPHALNILVPPLEN